MEKHRFHVAVSFAGDDREVAKRIAAALKRRRYSVFYDEFFIEEMVGRSLTEYLESVFSAHSLHCVMLVSEHYVRKPYPSHERRAALSRALTDAGYIIPVRLDESKIPGLPDDTCYLNYRTISFTKLINVIARRIDDRVDGQEFPCVRPVQPDDLVAASPLEREFIQSQLDSLLEKLEIRWADRLESLRQQYPQASHDRLLLRLFTQEVYRAIEVFLRRAEDDKVMRFLPSAPPRVVSLKRMEAYVEPSLVELLDELHIFKVVGRHVELDKRGQIIASSIMDSVDIRLGALTYYFPFYALGLTR